MADDQPTLQDDIERLTQNAAAEMEAASNAYDEKNRIGGTLSSEEDANQSTAGDDHQTEGTDTAEEEETQELVFGKYKSLEAAKDAYMESANSLSRARQEADQLRLQNQQLQALFNQKQQGPQEPEEDIYKTLEDLGLPPQILKRAVSQEASEVVNKLFQPLIGEATAEQHMLESVPGYTAEVGNSVNKWVQSHPEVKDLVERARGAGEYVLAKEWAYLRYQQEHATQLNEAQQANKQVRDEVVKEAKKSAGITKSRNTATQESRKPKDDKYMESTDFQKLVQSERDGYPKGLARWAVGDKLPDELFS